MFTQEQKKYLSGLIIAAVVVGIILLLGLAINAFKQTKYIGLDVESANVLTFSGEAEVRVVPDIANISFSVREEGEDASVAEDVVSEKVSVILDLLDDEGVDEKDIRTQNYNTSPRYDWVDGERILKGYVVNQSISVIVRDIDDAGDIVSLLIDNGADSLNGPQFEVEDDEFYEREARRQAIAAAKEKAEELADDLGVRLIRIVSFNENGGGFYPQPYMESAAYDAVSLSVQKAGPELPIGENIITASVTISYEIQ
jgi:uncharacterized protein YggE